MPSKSEAQRRAMQAAAHGKSTIGIPKKVGKEFAMADALRNHRPMGNYTDPNGTHHTHWSEGKKSSASNQGGASVGGAA